jgi:hypothetical protein
MLDGATALAKNVLPVPVLVGMRWVKRRLAGVGNHAKLLIMNKSARRRRIFRDIYKNSLWGHDENSKYFSGIGSRGEAAAIYARCMAELLKRHVAELGRPITVVDLGCGDFQIGGALTAEVPDLIYIGCDIVPEIVEHNTKLFATGQITFRQLDMVVDPLPDADVYLVRQVLQHLSNAEIVGFLRRVSCKYLYVTEGQPEERVGPINPDKVTGAEVRFDWRTGRGRGVELSQPPYCLSTQEVFRAFSPPNEVIVTELVSITPVALTTYPNLLGRVT